MNRINLIIVSTSCTCLVGLLAGGVVKPELLEKDSYTNTVSLLVGGLLGVVTGNQSSTVQVDNRYSEDDFNIK